MMDLGLSRKYRKGHGKELREERRSHERELADILASSRMAELERSQIGETRRAELREAGLGRRLGREQEFARPRQEVEVERLEALRGLKKAEAAKVRYGTEFERGSEGILQDILESRRSRAESEAEEARLGISEARRDISLRDEAEIRAAEARTEAGVAKPLAPVEPRRKMRPGLRRALWEGTPTKTGLTLPGLGAPLYGYKNIADWLGHGMKKGYEYAFPRTR